MGIAGCSQPQEPIDVDPAAPFQIGPPLSNPSIVAVIQSEMGSDTLFADAFNQNIVRLHSMFPDVMSDSEQESSIRREIVKQFVLEKLILQEADADGLTVDSSEVEARLGAFRASFPDEAAYRAELERFSQSEDDLADQFRIELTRDAISRMVESETPEPTDADVEVYRNAMAERLLTQHILFMVDEEMSADERRSLRNRAETVLDSALAGANFGDLARNHSDDAGTARLGGELPWFRRGEMVEGFEEAAFGLNKTGEITDDLVRTTYGYHIIRLIDRETDEPAPIDSAKSELRRQRIREAERDLLRRLQEQSEVSVNPDLVSGF